MVETNNRQQTADSSYCATRLPPASCRLPPVSRPPVFYLSLVIGYGNPLRGDDGVGPRVARILAASRPCAALRVIVCRQLTPELAQAVSRAGQVIFVDACVGPPPGRIGIRHATPSAGYTPGLSHGLPPDDLLALTALAYGRCPPARVVTLAGANFEHGGGLSPRVRAAVPRLLATVRGLLRKSHANSPALGYNRSS